MTLGPSQQSYCDNLGWRPCPRPVAFVVQQMRRLPSIEDRIAEEDAEEERRAGGQCGMGA